MKKTLALMLALLLCLSMMSASAEVTKIGTLGVDAMLISQTDRVRIGDDNGYALATLDGTLLTAPVYYSNFYVYSNYLSVIKLEGMQDERNATGLMTLDGVEVTPFIYGDMEVYNQYWAAGIKIVETTGGDYDYSSFGGGHYLMDVIDLYYLPESKLVASFTRENFKTAAARGEYINVENRADGSVTAYDSNGNVVAQNLAYSSDFTYLPANEPFKTFYQDGLYGLTDAAGNVLMDPAFSSIYTSGAAEVGHMRVSNDGKYGLIDLQGNVLVPAEFDSIEFARYGAYDPSNQIGYVSGAHYVCVIKDGKLGYADVYGNVTCEPKYAADNMFNNGISASYTDMAGNFGILAADGVDTVLEGYADVNAFTHGSGMYYNVRNSEGLYGVIDWHGNIVLPLQFKSIEMSGSGNYLLARTADYSCEVYCLNNAAGEMANAENAVVRPYPGNETQQTEQTQPAEQQPQQTEQQTQPAEQQPAAGSAHPLKGTIDSIIVLLNADATANGVAVVTLLESILPQADAATAATLTSVITLLKTDAAANASAAVTLLNTIIQ